MCVGGGVCEREERRGGGVCEREERRGGGVCEREERRGGMCEGGRREVVMCV